MKARHLPSDNMAGRQDDVTLSAQRVEHAKSAGRLGYRSNIQRAGPPTLPTPPTHPPMVRLPSPPPAILAGENSKITIMNP